MTKPILLFDAKNILYRAGYACHGEPKIVTVALGFMADCVSKFKPKWAGVFWDASSDGGWRRKIFPAYKERADQRGDVRAKVAEAEPMIRDLLPLLGVTQFYRDDAEADDLIYSACRILYPQDIIIVSSDKDYTQIVYRTPSVRLYDHREQKFTTHEQIKVDPAIQKSLMGDDSDEIPGYSKVGPVGSAKLAASIDELNAFLATHDPSLYLRNRLLIDLSMCPSLYKNTVYVQKQLSEKHEFDRAAIYKMALKVPKLAEEYNRAAAPFRLIAETED